jgi:predicted RNase H-like HicB family nuclease
MKYLIVIEKTGQGYRAHAPDVRGCVVTAPTRAEVEREIAEAVTFQVSALKLEGMTLRPSATATYVDVAV